MASTTKRCLCGLALALLASGAHAHVELTACSHELPPHSYEEDGEARGMATEILREVARSLQWRLTIRYANWMRSKANAAAGHCDLVYTILKTPTDERLFAYPSEPLPLRRNVIFALKAAPVSYDGNLERFMRENTVGIYRGKAVNSLFEVLKLQEWARVQTPSTSDNLMRMLLARRFAAAIEDQETGIYQLEQLGALDQVRVLRPPLSVVPAYVAFSRTSPAAWRVKEFSAALKAFKRTARYRQILARYKAG